MDFIITAWHSFWGFVLNSHKKTEDHIAELEQKIKELENKKIKATGGERMKLNRDIRILTKRLERLT